MKDHSNIIEAIRAGDERVLDQLYRDHRQAFVHWMKRYMGAREEDALDIFQESLILMYENIMQERLTELKSSLRTYLFAIGKNLMINKLKRDQKTVGEVDVLAHNLQATSLPYDALVKHETSEQMTEWISSLGSPCNEILKLFYYQRFSMEAIAHKLNYKSPDVAKAQKNRCMKKLKDKAIHLIERN